jgi:hypothetical protein
MDGQKLKTIREIDLDYFATEGLYEFCTSYLQYADAMCTHIQGRMTAAHMSVERIVETSLVCGGGVHGLATSQSYKSRALRICQLDWDGTRVSVFSLCLASPPIRWRGEFHLRNTELIGSITKRTWLEQCALLHPVAYFLIRALVWNDCDGLEPGRAS